MNKNILILLMLAFSTHTHAGKKVTATFAQKQFQFFAKDIASMQEEVSWEEFNSKRKSISEEYKKIKKEDPFLELSFEGQTFIKIPGFEGGSCLWSHLGIAPDHMYPIIESCAEEILKKANKGPVDEKLSADAMEMADVLDPEGILEKDLSGDSIKNLALLRKNYKEITRDIWTQGVTLHGGAALQQNQFAFRPPNSDRFFQKVANYLKVNIVIWTPNDTYQKVGSPKEFYSNFNAADRTLHLMQDAQGHGSHYDIVVQKGDPVSTAIIEEMEYYLESQQKIHSSSSNKKRIIKK